MDQLLFWNKTKYADILAGIFGKENVITDNAQFLDKLKDFEKFKCIIALCELNWCSDNATTKMQRFCGIELIKELRRAHNIDLPVLFVSFYSLPKLFNAETEILTSIGHSFYQLPATPKTFINLLAGDTKLTPIELKDIQLFSCNPKGIVNVKIHQIQGIVNQINNESPVSLKEQLAKCIEEIHSVFKVNADISLNKFHLEFSNISKENINKALRFIDEIGNELIDRYTASTFDRKTISVTKKPWKLLLLDDELNAESGIVTLLKEKGVDVICTSNAEAAMKALSNDNSLRGNISLILSDYRLNKKEGEIQVQQKKQGYTFIQEVGEKFHNKLLSAIVYSGMPRQFLLETFKTFKIRSEIYSKIDFKLDDIGARNFLVNRIIELGDENYNALLALPLASEGWAKHLHNTYLLFRSQRDYEKRERDICDFCTDWVEKFRTGQNPPTPMIKGDSFQPQKKETEKSTLERFEAFYKTRRLALYLNIYFAFRKSDDPSDIIPKMLSYPKKKMDTPELKRRFLSQTIGFKKEEFPFGVTVEELCWLEYDLGIKVLDSYKRFRNTLSECESLIGGFIQDVTILKKALTEIDFCYVDSRKHKLLFDPMTDCPYLFDRMDMGICLEWLDLYSKQLTGGNLEEYLQVLKIIKKIWK